MAHEASTESDTIRIVLAGGPDDREAIQELLANKGSLPIISTFGETKSLADLAALIHLADAIVCVDSAPMHVAVGLRKPVVALFGPTNPNLLIPLAKPFTHLWDERDGKRQFFDGLGVNIEPERVFDKLMATLRQS
jgi:ADP-heptose:LPS heptosyltransferase